MAEVVVDLSPHTSHEFRAVGWLPPWRRAGAFPRSSRRHEHDPRLVAAGDATARYVLRGEPHN